MTFWPKSESDSDFLLFLTKFRAESDSDREANLRMEVTCYAPFFYFYFISFVNGVYFQDVPFGMALLLSLLSKLDAICTSCFRLGLECLSRRRSSCA